MAQAPSKLRELAGKVCVYSGNLLVGLHGAALLFDPSVLRAVVLAVTIAVYVVLQKTGAKLLDGFFGAVEKL